MNRPDFTLIFLVAAVFGGSASGAAAKDVDMDKGRTMFLQGTKPNCALCHTLQHAGASGAIGPNLDELKPDTARVAQAIREGVGVMPAFPDLSEDEVKLLSEYVSAVAK